MPGEVSEVAHQIVRLSKTDGIDFKISEVHIGLAGDCIEPNEDGSDEKVPDIVTLQGLCLIHLKSVALLVREAQCCSSSDESDSSLSSRGSSSIADEDREMKVIEKNVVELLIKLRFWMNGKTSFLKHILCPLVLLSVCIDFKNSFDQITPCRLL